MNAIDRKISEIAKPARAARARRAVASAVPCPQLPSAHPIQNAPAEGPFPFPEQRPASFPTAPSARLPAAPIHEIGGASAGDGGQPTIVALTSSATIAPIPESGASRASRAKLAATPKARSHDSQPSLPAKGRAKKAEAREIPTLRMPSSHPSPATGARLTNQRTAPRSATSDKHSSDLTVGAGEAAEVATTKHHTPRRPQKLARKDEGGGLVNCATRVPAAPTTPSDCDGDAAAGDDLGHLPSDTPSRSAEVVSTTNAEIREQWRRRQAWHRAEKSLTLQAKALCRRLADEGDKAEADKIYRAALGEGLHPMSDVAFAAMFPLTEARDGVEKHRKIVEKRLQKLAKQLPVAPWVEGIYGASMMSLAAIVGEAGDIGTYGNPGKLWKRMGLAVFDGQRQRRVSDADLALLHGYSPGRRSVVWNIGGSLIGGMGLGPRPSVGEDLSTREDLSEYQKLFLERCRYEVVRDPAMGREPVVNKKTGEIRESYSKHCAARAKRYVEKRFLRNLWSAWRRAGDGS